MFKFFKNSNPFVVAAIIFGVYWLVIMAATVKAALMCLFGDFCS
jgi:hypothetical protein